MGGASVQAFGSISPLGEVLARCKERREQKSRIDLEPRGQPGNQGLFARQNSGWVAGLESWH